MRLLTTTDRILTALTANQTINLNWLWLALIGLAVIFLMIVIVMTIMEAGRSTKRVKQLTKDLEPVMLSIQTGMKRSEQHINNVNANIAGIQSGVESSLDLVGSDVDHMREVAELSLENTKIMTGDIALATQQTTEMIKSISGVVQSIREAMAKKKDSKDPKQQAKKSTAAKHKDKKRPLVKVEIELDNKPKAVRKGLSIARKQKRKALKMKKTVQKKKARTKAKANAVMAKGKKAVRSGQHHLDALRKKYHDGKKRVRRFRRKFS